ncbi:TNF receptor-associated factor 2 [Stylophora pistillata]|uniref:TNF receptor-associated factor 2 n=1 Tax=Stylophora pistillata TaxID=50429 RepID=A0A2B4RBM0_STYPI|nr:TNF receptor-associated factor 2 [Stylophora pistillata]
MGCCTAAATCGCARDETSNEMKCLVDEKNFFPNETFADNFMRREVSALVIHCLSIEEGCLWRGKVKHLEDHKQKECKFLSVPCVYDACGVMVKRADLADHLKKECRFRQEKCLVCDEDVDHCRMKEHLRLNHNYLHCQMDNLGDVVDDLHHSMYHLRDKYHHLQDEHRHLQDKYRHLQNEQRRLHGEVQQLKECPRMFEQGNQQQMQNEEYVRQQEFSSYDGQYLWKISDFSRKRNDAVNREDVSVVSPSFSTSRFGYKMCAQIYLNGDGMGRGTHISVYFMVMRGQYDALLPWPFRQKVTFMLLDQDHVEHVTDAFRPDPNSASFQRPRSETNIASGCPMFCALSELNNHAYVRDDTMFVKIIVDTDGL